MSAVVSMREDAHDVHDTGANIDAEKHDGATHAESVAMVVLVSDLFEEPVDISPCGECQDVCVNS